MEAFPRLQSGRVEVRDSARFSVEVSTFSRYLPFGSLLSTLEKVLRCAGGQKEVELGVGTPLI